MEKALKLTIVNGFKYDDNSSANVYIPARMKNKILIENLNILKKD